MKHIFWMIYIATILLFASAHGQEPTPPQPPIWQIPVMPVLPPAPIQPIAAQPQPPQQTYRIRYPTPLRSFFFGSHLVPVQPPPTMIRAPYLWEPK